MTTLQELADRLPNGFHDARVSACALDFVARTVVFELEVWMGDESEPFQEGHRLSPQTLRAAAEIGAEVALTVYSLADDAPERAG